METKLSAALCALLVLSLGSADHDAGSTVSPSKLGNESDPSGDVAPGPGPDPVENNRSDTNPPTLNDSGDAATENQTFPIEAQEENATDVSAATQVSHKNKSSTGRPPSRPTAAPSEGRASAPPATSVTAALATPPSNGNASSNGSDAVRPGSLATTATQTGALSPNSTWTPEQRRPETSPATTTSTLSGSAAAHGPTVSQPSTSGPQTSRIPLTSSKAPLKTATTSTGTTSTTSSSASPLDTSIQARTHAGSPSQLNMGGDSHGPPTLDPLLAGLVSAFILTAVVITLLLFLKLRRRNNRPEFRRLQDLPMDDMMEDTPLSMYSY